MSTEPTTGLLMVVSARGICAACGHEERAPGPDLYALMLAHAETCEQHPLRQRLVAAEAALTEAIAARDALSDDEQAAHEEAVAADARAKALAEAAGGLLVVLPPLLRASVRYLTEAEMPYWTTVQQERAILDGALAAHREAGG